MIKKWKPQIGERYVFIGHSGCVHPSLWAGIDYDYYRFNEGNCFQFESEITAAAHEQILRNMKEDYDKT